MEQEYLTLMNRTLNIEAKCSSEPSNLNLTVSVSFYVIHCLLLPPTLYVNILNFRMLKRESLSVSMEIKIYCIFNIIGSIIDIVHFGILIFAFPASVYFGPWYCYTFSVIMAIRMFRIFMHSLTLCIYRYIFIIYREVLNEKQRKQVTWIVVLVKWLAILILSSKFVIFGKDEFALFWTSICDGSYINTQTKQVDTTILEYLAENIFYKLSKDDDRALITIFGNVHGGLSYVLPVFCVLLDVLGTVILVFNPLEVFLYSKIAKYMKS